MKTIGFQVSLVAALLGALIFCTANGVEKKSGSAMKVSSSAFKEGEQIPSQFTCDGADRSPALQFAGIPQAAKSLALIVDDPDAPGGLFTHWIVWNIEPATARIDENNSPVGAMKGTNDFGKSGYGGPCPPSGTHRYIFKLIALDQKLSLQAGARRTDLDRAIKGHVVAEAQLMGRYTRQK